MMEFPPKGPFPDKGDPCEYTVHSENLTLCSIIGKPT